MDGGWVGVLTADLHLPDARSLKAKRKELQRVKQRLAGRLGCSVAEVDHHDLWQRATISLAVVGRTAADVEELLADADRRLHADEAFQALEVARETWPIELEPSFTGAPHGDTA
jgi:uncharacterized protein YlxP (DUF503 family)